MEKVSFTFRMLYPHRKGSRYLFHKELSGPQRRTRLGGGEGEKSNLLVVTVHMTTVL